VPNFGKKDIAATALSVSNNNMTLNFYCRRRLMSAKAHSIAVATAPPMAITLY